MSADTLLSRLDGVRRTGPGRWLARCPGHDDRSPSLAIRELGDGRILLHDFGGCETEVVLGAVGMTWADVMPARAIDNYRRGERAPFPALDVLRALEFETLIVVGVAAAIGKGALPNDDDRLRVRVAHSRILAGLRLVGGGI